MTYVNDTGYPSSTQVIRPFVKTEWFTDEDRERGNAVHEAMAAHAKGLWTPPLRPDWQPYVDSGRRWFDNTISEVLLVEERLIDEERKWCGKPDLIAIIKGDTDPTLIDYKTAQAAEKIWALQAASYRRLAEVDRGIICHRSISVRPDKNGKSAKIKEYTNYSRHLNIFIGMVNAWNFLN
jgi:hypothetical protein